MRPDRRVFRATVRPFAVANRVEGFLAYSHVLLKDGDAYVAKKTAQLKRASLAEPRRLGRPVRP